jgi:hypothetical protein
VFGSDRSDFIHESTVGQPSRGSRCES